MVSRPIAQPEQVQIDYLDELCSYSKECATQIKEALGHVFKNLEAAVEDSDIYVKILKIGCFAIQTLKLVNGHTSSPSRLEADWTESVSVVDGLLLFGGVSGFIDDKFENHSSWKKMVMVAFIVADCAGTVLWLIAMEVPVLGPLSESATVIKVIALVAEGASLAGLFSDIVDVATKLPTKSEHKYNMGCMRITERVVAIASIVLGFLGAAFAPVAAGLGAAAFTLSIARFIYKLNIDDSEEEDIDEQKEIEMIKTGTTSNEDNMFLDYVRAACIDIKTANGYFWDAGKKIVTQIEGVEKLIGLISSIFDAVVLALGDESPAYIGKMTAAFGAFKDVTGAKKFIKEGDDYFSKPFNDTLDTIRRICLYAVAILSLDNFLAKMDLPNFGLSTLTKIGNVALKDILFGIVPVCSIITNSISIHTRRHHDDKFAVLRKRAAKLGFVRVEDEKPTWVKITGNSGYDAKKGALNGALVDKVTGRLKELTARIAKENADQAKLKAKVVDLKVPVEKKVGGVSVEVVSAEGIVITEEVTEKLEVIDEKIADIEARVIAEFNQAPIAARSYFDLRQGSQILKNINQRASLKGSTPWLETDKEKAARLKKIGQLTANILSLVKMSQSEFIQYKVATLDASQQNSSHRHVKASIDLTASVFKLVGTITGISKAIIGVEVAANLLHEVIDVDVAAIALTINSILVSLGITSSTIGMGKFLYDEYNRDFVQKQSPSAWLSAAAAA